MWNVNPCNAIVAAFNLQGSAWDRNRRQYLTYTSKPPTLRTEIRVSDVALFATQQQPVEAQNGAAGNGAAERQLPDGREGGSGGAAVPQSWVAAVAGEETLHRLRAHEGIPFQLAGTLHPQCLHSCLGCHSTIFVSARCVITLHYRVFDCIGGCKNKCLMRTRFNECASTVHIE